MLHRNEKLHTELLYSTVSRAFYPVLKAYCKSPRVCLSNLENHLNFVFFFFFPLANDIKLHQKENFQCVLNLYTSKHVNRHSFVPPVVHANCLMACLPLNVISSYLMNTGTGTSMYLLHHPNERLFTNSALIGDHSKKQVWGKSAQQKSATKKGRVIVVMYSTQLDNERMF